MKIGDIIKKYRNEKGFTQKSLAEKANISRSYLADLENNRYNPSLDVLKAIAKALNVNSSMLLAEKFDAENDVSQLKEESALYETGKFKTPQAAMKFILEQPAIAAYGGFDVNKMSDEEIMDFANELLNQLKLLGFKYKK